eukprot:4574421-Amphidinium_carterae.1
MRREAVNFVQHPTVSHSAQSHGVCKREVDGCGIVARNHASGDTGGVQAFPACAMQLLNII